MITSCSMPCCEFQISRATGQSHTMALAALAFIAAILCAGGRAAAQTETNRVYIDDSPRAWQVFRRAQDQEPDNPGEAARLYQELLDDYPLKLIPLIETDPNHLVAVRARVNDALLGNPALLARYRKIETTQAERMLLADELETLRLSRFLTEPALEATMRLAQDSIESAHFQRARQLLLELGTHPDLAGRRAAYRWLMLGLASNHINDTATRNHAMRMLEEATDPHSRLAYAELMRLLRAGPGPTIERGVHSLTLGPPAVVDSMVDNPIWSIALEHSLFVRQSANKNERSQRVRGGRADRARASGDWLTAVPTIAGRAIYVNEGQVIRALDRFSVREFWRTKIGDRAYTPIQNAQSVGDLNVIAIEGDRLVTVTGHGSGQMRLGRDYVVCLNRITGELLWQINLDKLGDADEYDDLFPQGGVAIADGTAYILARKVTKQVLTSIYVVALRLGDVGDQDRVKWIRYIASSATMQGSENRPYSYLQVDGGRVYVATPIGAIACLDAIDGEPIWLKRLDAPLQLVQPKEPWKMSAPVVTETQVIAMGPDGRSVFVLDRRTGNELRRIRADRWGRPDYLIANDSTVFAIGSDVLAFSRDAFDDPLWRLNGDRQALDEYDIRGRVQIAGDTLAVPTQAKLLLIDGHTGQMLRTLDVQGAGNPLVYGAELFYTDSDSIVAFMPLSVAEAMLREQMTTSPHNAAPSLSLLRLANRAPTSDHAIDLALDASEHTMLVLTRIDGSSRYDAAQRELFDALIAVASRAPDVAHAKAERLHDRIRSIAASNDQIVEASLARGDWLTITAIRSDPSLLPAAVAAYQHILSDAALADTLRNARDVYRPASQIAFERLHAMIQQFGSAAYANPSREAEVELAALAGSGDPDELLRIAARFPFAPAVRSTIIQAARTLAERDQPREAANALMTLLRSAPHDDDAAEALGGLYELAVRESWFRQARYWLVQAQARGLDDLPVADGLAPIARLLSQLPGRAFPNARPALGTLEVDAYRADAAAPQPLPTVDGLLLTLAADVENPPTQYALVSFGQTLRCIDATDLEEKWTAQLLTSNPQLAAHSSETAVVTFSGPGDFVQVFDVATGVLRWQSIALPENMWSLRRNGGNLPRRRARVIANGQPQNVQHDDVLTFATANDLIVVGRSGGMARYSYERDESDPLWKADHSLYFVEHAARNDLVLALAGEPLPGSTSQEPPKRMAMVDPVTGAEYASFDIPEDDPIRWLRITPRGTILFATGSAIRAIDATTGDLLWANTVVEVVAQADRAWVFGDYVILGDTDAALRSIRISDGRAENNFQPLPDLTWKPSRVVGVQVVGDRVLVHYKERIVWFDRAGEFAGQDAITSDRDYTHVVVGSPVVFAISHARRGQQVRALRNRPGQQHVNVIYPLSRNSKLLTDSFEFPTGPSPVYAAWGIDGWLLLSEETSTIALPAHPVFPAKAGTQ